MQLALYAVCCVVLCGVVCDVCCQLLYAVVSTVNGSVVLMPVNGVFHNSLIGVRLVARYLFFATTMLIQ